MRSDGDGITSVSTANKAPEQGYKLHVRHCHALGLGFHDFQIHAHELPDYGVEGLLGMDFLEKFNFRPTTDFRVHVHDLPDGFGIEGLVGLSFLRNFDYEVRSTLGQLRVDRASSLA